MIDKLLAKFKSQPGCVTFAPAAAQDLKNCSKTLCQNDSPPIPDAYAAFLGLSDGLSFDGIELFSCQPHLRTSGDYTFPDLVSMNKPYKRYDFFRSRLILGRTSESVIIYHAEDNSYALIDRINLRRRLEVSAFAELLQEFVKLSRLS